MRIGISWRPVECIPDLSACDKPEALEIVGCCLEDLSFNPVLDWDAVQDNPALRASLPWDFDQALQVQERAREIADCEECVRPQEPDGFEVLIGSRGVCGDFAEAAALEYLLA